MHIIVGPSETPFDVHQQLLCNQSPYFNHLLKEHIDSGEKLKFPKIDKDVFADFISWLYCGRISYSQSSDGSESPTRPARVLHLYQLWTLASWFGIQGLRTRAMEHLVGGFNQCKDSIVTNNAVWHAFLDPHSPAGCELRSFTVRNWAERATKSKFLDFGQYLPMEFMKDLIMACLEKVMQDVSDVSIILRSISPFLSSLFFRSILICCEYVLKKISLHKKSSKFSQVNSSKSSATLTKAEFTRRSVEFQLPDGKFPDYYPEKVTVELRPIAHSSSDATNKVTVELNPNVSLPPKNPDGQISMDALANEIDDIL